MLAVPESLDDALDALADQPSLTVLAGGTDLMVAMNYGQLRPSGVLSLRRLDELRRWHRLEDGRLWLGAGLTYRRLQAEPLAQLVPGLAQAARTVGSSQIRNTGTLGGNLATASPAGDTLGMLAGLDTQVVLRSAGGGERRLALLDGDDPFLIGPKRTARRPDELLTAVIVGAHNGPQEFLKIGPRNAMVIAVASCALVADVTRRSVRVTLGSVGPVPMRCHDAERWAAERIDWDRSGRDALALRDTGEPRSAAHTELLAEFGERCAASAAPIDDHRSTAAYRRRACAVLATRALRRCLVPASTSDSP